jgi:capsular polysaccharide biosynthesis protein
MDLISICKAIWRHKLAMLPVLLVTLAGMYYVLAIKPPVYQSTAEVLLVNPKIPNSSNSNSNADNPYAANPYANLGNLQEVADVVIDKVTSPAVSQGLINAGASPEYQVALSADVGSPPIVIITGVGSSPTSAINCATLVATAVQNELYTLQANSGVTTPNMINSIEYVKPETAKVTVSPKLRELIAVLAVGALLLLVVVSVADVLERRRRDRADVASDELAALDRYRGMHVELAVDESRPVRRAARLFDSAVPDGIPRPRNADYGLPAADYETARHEPAVAEPEPPAAREEPMTAREEPMTTHDGPMTTHDGPMTVHDEPMTADDEPAAADDTTEFAAIDPGDGTGRRSNGKVGASLGERVSSPGNGR